MNFKDRISKVRFAFQKAGARAKLKHGLKEAVWNPGAQASNEWVLSYGNAIRKRQNACQM